jgi:hypothetical protein
MLAPDVHKQAVKAPQLNLLQVSQARQREAVPVAQVSIAVKGQMAQLPQLRNVCHHISAWLLDGQLRQRW